MSATLVRKFTQICQYDAFISFYETLKSNLFGKMIDFYLVQAIRAKCFAFLCLEMIICLDFIVKYGSYLLY